MKKRFLFIYFILVLMICSFAHATAIGVEVIPDGGPGVAASAVTNENAAVNEYKQYDLDDKFVYTLNNNCNIECPKNINTNDGMVSTKNHRVADYDLYGGYAYLYFDYTGLKKKSTKFYIKASNAAGVMIDLKEIYVGYHSEYNERNGKITYKASTESCRYKILPSAVKVQVLGVLDSY